MFILKRPAFHFPLLLLLSLSILHAQQLPPPAAPFPVDLSFLGYSGGSGNDDAYMTRVDRQGNAYLAGTTQSVDFPQQPAASPPAKWDLFLLKCRDDGSIIYSRTLAIQGRSLMDMAIGSNDDLIMLLRSQPLDDWLTPDAQQKSRSNWGIVVLDSTGYVKYVSYLPDEKIQQYADMETDAYGDLYFIAHTYDTPPSTTGNAMFAQNQGSEDGFIMIFCGTDYSLAYASCFGGMGHEEFTHIAVQDDQLAVAGIAWDSGDYPMVNAAQPNIAGGMDFVLSCLSSDGQRVNYSTYLGGSAAEYWNASGTFHRRLRFDEFGNLYFVGETRSSDYPVTDTLFLLPTNYQAIALTRFNRSGQITFGTLICSDKNTYCGEMDVDSCGSVLLSGVTLGKNFPLTDPLTPEGENFITVINTNTREVSYNTRIGRVTPLPSLTLHGNTMYLGGSSNAAVGLPPTAGLNGAHTTVNDPFLGALSMPALCSREALHTGLKPDRSVVEVEFSLPDTLLIDLRRGVTNPSTLTALLIVRNPSATIPTDSVHITLQLPPGLSITHGSPGSTVVLPSIQPGGERTITWHLHPVISLVAPYTSLELSVLALQKRFCAGSDFTIERMTVVYRDLAYTELACDVSLMEPPQLRLDGKHLRSDSATLRLQVTNLTGEDAALKGVRLAISPESGATLYPPQTLFTLLQILRAHETKEVFWTLRVPTWLFDRELHCTVAIVDTFGFDMQFCDSLWKVPGAGLSDCEAVGPAVVRCQSGVDCTPSLVGISVTVENTTDTTTHYSALQMDLSSAPHLALRAGDMPSRPPFYIRERFRRVFMWDLIPRTPIVESCSDTIRFSYVSEWDQVTHTCQVVVKFEVLVSEVFCSIEAPDTIAVNREGTGYVEDTFEVEVVFANTGNTARPLTHAILNLEGAQLLTSAQQTLQTLAPGDHDTLRWWINIPSMLEARVVQLSVAAYEGEVEATRCMHHIDAPAIPLVCALQAPDTLTYDGASDAYTPSPFVLTGTLNNHSSETLTLVHAQLLTASLTRCALLGPASRDTAVLGPGASWTVTWTLDAKYDVQSEDNPLIVEFDAAETGAHTDCMRSIHVEGGTPEHVLRCVTAGHDTVWVDDYIERIIPDPLQLQYTLKNDGQSVTPACEVAILPPAMLRLVNGADSIRSIPALSPGAQFSVEWLLAIDYQALVPGPWIVRWETSCGDSVLQPACDHPIDVVNRRPAGLVVSPWLLRFEAEHNGPLPAPQTVQTWMGDASPANWSISAKPAWIDSDPASGSNVQTVTVQPNTTGLAVGTHTGMLDFSHTPLSTGDVQIVYVLRNPLSVAIPPLATKLRINAVYPNPVEGSGKIVIVCETLPETEVQLRMHDLLGREVWTKTIRSDQRGIGTTRMTFTSLVSGSYVLTVTAGAASDTRLVLIEK
ncbi:T9SS type A sorting domain-containing protein [bacterium]|nr:T9SS type A sorting domain-containing protein [bacterium]